MTDDAEQYFNAWKFVFAEKDTNKILCSWHVDRAWRKGLQQHIGESSKRAEMYHLLRVLLSEREESQFRVCYRSF